MKKKKNSFNNNQREKIYLILSYLLLTIAAILAYSNSFNCEFQFDDADNITNQPVIKDLKNFTNPNLWTNVNFRPLSMFTFAINYHLHQLDVTGYHIFNLIIHILCGFLVFLFMKKIFGIYLVNKESSSEITLLSLFVSLIFLLHPIQTQSVTYIVQRMTSLSGLFFLLAVYLYTIGRIRHSQKGFSFSVFLSYFFVFISIILSLLAKQIAVTIPLALLLIEVCFIRNNKGKICKKFLLISLSAIILIFLVVAVTGNLPRETDEISRLNYLITQFRVMIKYIQLLILPINQNLDHDVRFSVTFWHFKNIAGFLLLSFLIFLSIFFYKKDKLITFGIGWFYISLALESTIFPISGLIYEHRLYLALIGFSVCLVTIIYRLTMKRKKMMTLILVLLVILYGVATFQRNKVWKNRLTLWTDVLHKSPQKSRAYYNMGNILTDTGRQKMATNYYSKAIKLKPDYVDAIVNLGNILRSMGNIDKAIYYYKKALKYNPKYTKALNNLGVILTDRGELEKARKYYEKGLMYKPNDAELINNFGIVCARKGEYKKAIEYFKKALDLKPNYENAKKNLEITKKSMNLQK